jgi:transglutaminase-like putative cysteine protease
MATTRPNDTARGADAALAATVASTALVAAAALALVRVFEESRWMGAALGAVLLPQAIGLLLARRRAGGITALFVWIVAAILFTVVAIEPHETARGIPTARAFGAWWDDLSSAARVLRTSTTPVVAEQGALLLALLAVWAASAAAHWSATRLEGTVGAIAPTLALFVAVSALGDGPYAVTTGVYAAACALFLLAQQQVGLADRRTWFHVRPARRSQLVTGGVAIVAAIAVVGAILGPRLPTAQSAGLLDYEEWGEGRGGPGSVRIVSPLVNIGDSLNQQNPVEVFTVRSDARTYWRLVALDDYDGQVWGLRDTKASRGYPLADARGPNRRVSQEFAMGPYGGPFLPAAYQAIDTRFLSREYSIHESSTLFLESDNYDGLEYEVESVIPEPTAEILAAIPLADPETFARYLALPDDFPRSITELATQLTAGTANPYERALALQAFFRDLGGFEYDTSIRGHDEDALERFVLEDKRGFCEQFAGSYAAMARSVGLPARVAVGFTPGALGDDGLFHVSTDNAHAWPEVWFEGIGWMRFEPTPGRYEPTSTDYTGTGAEDPDPGNEDPAATTTSAAGSTSTTVRGPVSSTSFRVPDIERDVSAGGDGGSGGGATGTAGRVFATLAAVAAAALLLAVGVLAAGFLGAVVRRRRRSRGDARRRVVGAWAQAVERLAESGITRRPASTPVEFAMREAPALGAGAAGPPLLALAHLHTNALFDPEPPSDDEAHEAWRHVALIERALAAMTRRTVRWRRRVARR